MEKFFIYFSLFMALLFIAAGPYIVINPPQHSLILENKYIVGFILSMYGIFRLYRTYMMIKERK